MTLLCALAAIALSCATPSLRRDELDEKAVVATIDGRAIDAGRFTRFVLAEKEHSTAGADALDQVVQERLVETEARRRGIVVSSKDVELRMAQIDRGLRDQSQGKLGLDDHLASLKIDRAEFETLLRKSIAAERMMGGDFGLAPGAPVPPEKQSLWFQELKSRAHVRTEGIADGLAAEFEDGRITRGDWAMKIWKALPAADADRLFDDFVGVELLLAAGEKAGLVVTPEMIAREIDERSALLRQKFASEGLAADGVDYFSTLKAHGEDPEAVVRGDRFKAEIMLKEMARRRHGQDGFKAFYEEHRADFDQAFGRRVRLSTLFLRAAQTKSAKTPRTWTEASDELEAMRKRIESGGVPIAEAFASLAKLRSEHSSAKNGGDLGLLSRAELDKIGLPPSLLDDKVGELQGPIVTAEGVHLLYVAETRPASPFEEIAPEVEKAARRELLRELRADRKIERKI